MMRPLRPAFVLLSTFFAVAPALVAQSAKHSIALENRAHGFVGEIDSSGVVLRGVGAETFEWRIALVAFVRGDVAALAPGEAPRVRGTRVEIPRGNAIDAIEWFESDARGLEHGVDLTTRPAGDDALPLVLRFATSGDLVPASAGDGVDFSRPCGGVVLRYDRLVAFDSAGIVLPSALFLDGATIVITVDDRFARYPITIDPIAANPAWNVTSGQAASSFGASLSSAGDVNGDGYDDVIVGAPTYTNGEGWEGRAFAYHGASGGLSTTPAWTVESNVANGWLGTSVAGVGDVDNDGFDDVLVGSTYFQNPQHWEGAAWFYRGSASGLSTTAAWTMEGNLNNAEFGASVAGAGDVDNDGYVDILVGAPGSSGFGRCLWFRGGASGPSLVANALLVSPQSNSGFAASIASAGDVDADGYADVLVGAGAYTNGQTGEGAIFVYRGAAAGLQTAVAAKAESNEASAALGFAVARAGDVNGDGFGDVIAGAPNFRIGALRYGDAFVFHGSATGLVTPFAWRAGPQQVDSNFGAAVGGAGDVNGDGFDDVIVGADSYNWFTINDGRAYVWQGSASGLPVAATSTAQPGNTHTYFGISVAGAGDVNGDGLADVVMGGHNFDNGNQRAWAYHGCANCATWGAYGLGKAMFNELRSTPPVLGATATLSMSGALPGNSVFVFAGFAPASIPFDGGTLLVLPAITLFGLPVPGNGQWTLAAPLPSTPGLAGAEMFIQAGFFDPPSAPGFYHSRQSQGVHWTFGF